MEQEELTPEQQERLQAAEQEALRIMNRTMSEGRRTPRRHMRFAVLVIAAGLLVFGIAWLVTII